MSIPASTAIADEHLTPRAIDAGVRIGPVHLKVADLERALAFYCGVLGFQLMQRFGQQAAFVSAGGYHHHNHASQARGDSAGGRIRSCRLGS